MIRVPANSVPGESPLLGFQFLLCPQMGDRVRRKREGGEGEEEEGEVVREMEVELDIFGFFS